MPRLEVSLTEDQIGDLSEWIEDGAYWPEGEVGRLHHEFNAENP
jgi:Arc/MetJ-type ribon-helix-helix transcriptional regulator